MKAVELTEEHKSKLIEMCKILFPEYKLIYGENSNGDGWANGLLSFSKNSKSSFSIHWFEFCMTYLVEKIQNSLPRELIWREQPPFVGNIYDWKKGNRWTLYTEFFFLYPKRTHKIHIVDYLYEEFKKIKQINYAL